MRHRILLAAAFLYLALANVIWIARDNRPPFWDTAGHATGALNVYDAFSHSGLAAIARIPSELLTGYYPPLYHTVIAGSWKVFGQNIAIARLTNLLAIAIVMFATYSIGKSLYDPFTAAIAATLVSFFPQMLWLSRETIIDYWLTAAVVLSLWILVKTNGFASRRWSILFGLAAGLGMLTKQTFALFLIVPALWYARKNWINASISAVIASAIAAYWYVPALPALRTFLSLNAAGGAFEGDPDRFSLGALVFYLRALEGYQVFLPLFLAFVVGLAILWRQFDEPWLPVLLSVLGGWLGLLLFQNKDPRYSAPLLPMVALIMALSFRQRRILSCGLAIMLLFQHYLVSFGVRGLPERVVLMRGADAQLRFDWNLYTQSYFDLWGKPRREDWKIEHVLATVGEGPLGLIPDIPRFDSQAFQFYIQRLNSPVRLERIGVLDETAIRATRYLLLAESDREHAASFAPDPRVNDYVYSHPEMFHLAEWFGLPNGAVIRLYKTQ